MTTPRLLTTRRTCRYGHGPLARIERPGNPSQHAFTLTPVDRMDELNWRVYQGGGARPEKIDNDRAAAIQACGFNPWPGPSMAEIDAQNQQARAIEEHARRQQAMAASEEARRRNPTLTNCDQGGCWGTDGTRYNRGAGNTFFSSKGGTCTAINGNQLHCP